VDAERALPIVKEVEQKGETNEDAVAGASMYFRDALNVASETQQARSAYDRLLDALRSDDTSAKLRAIAQAESVARLAGS
jgi:hypothetical protein